MSKNRNAPILDATVSQLCKDAKLDCSHDCGLKSGVTGTTGHDANDVECFCRDGFELGKDNKSCTGNISLD